MARKKGDNAHAMSFLRRAREYQKAADLVCDGDNTLWNPIYFLYSHAIELALKGFLRAANKVRQHHEIGTLYEECRTLGLRIGPDESTDIRNVILMLEEANDGQGLRYFRTKASACLDAGSCREPRSGRGAKRNGKG